VDSIGSEIRSATAEEITTSVPGLERLEFLAVIIIERFLAGLLGLG
jgi:hypothetical protein